MLLCGIKSGHWIPRPSRPLRWAFIRLSAQASSLHSPTPSNLAHPHAQSILPSNPLPLPFTDLWQKALPPPGLIISTYILGVSSKMAPPWPPSLPSLPYRSTGSAPGLGSCGSLCAHLWQCSTILPTTDMYLNHLPGLARSWHSYTSNELNLETSGWSWYKYGREEMME